ncbi:MAG: hypothetical protein ABII22_04145 [Candidatus Micrarchaeota archaeon]
MPVRCRFLESTSVPNRRIRSFARFPVESGCNYSNRWARDQNSIHQGSLSTNGIRAPTKKIDLSPARLGGTIALNFSGTPLFIHISSIGTSSVSISILRPDSSWLFEDCSIECGRSITHLGEYVFSLTLNKFMFDPSARDAQISLSLSVLAD